MSPQPVDAADDFATWLQHAGMQSVPQQMHTHLKVGSPSDVDVDSSAQGQLHALAKSAEMSRADGALTVASPPLCVALKL